MFADGQWYAAIANNLADGHGTLWKPVSGWLPDHRGYYWFYGHPPLAIWLQAVCFQILGDSLYTERLYSLVIGIMTVALIVLIWKELFRSEPAVRPFGWLPVMIWTMMPLASWGIKNNVLETTMTVFVLMATLFCLKAMTSHGRSKWLLLILSGVSVCLAFLSKGPPGLLPLAIPVIWWLILRKGKFLSAIATTALLVVSVSMFFGLILIDEEARDSLITYLSEQVWFSSSNEATTSNRLYPVMAWGGQLAIPAIACGITMTIVIWKTRLGVLRPSWTAFFLFVMTLASVLPLMVSLKQRTFYVIPALPFTAFLIGAICIPAFRQVSALVRQNLKLVITGAGAALLLGALTAAVFSAGKPKRDAVMLRDVKVLGLHIQDSIISASPHIRWTQWGLQAYLMRSYQISVDVLEAQREILIAEKSDTTFMAPEGYSLIELEGISSYVVYQRHPDSIGN
jgi:4-amino-4-deoxy-L-arabinose transferase-like glycosyltransferase